VKLWAAVRRNLVDPILRAQGTPTSLARGAALGTWLTFTPTVGIQMFLAALVALPLRANLPVALALIWLSNPLTIIPLYYAYYWVGTLLLALPARSYRELAQTFASLFRSLEKGGFLESLRSLGSEVLWPVIVGSLVIATVCTFPAYRITLWLALRRQARVIREAAAALSVEARPVNAAPGTAAPVPTPGAAVDEPAVQPSTDSREHAPP